VGGRSRAPSAAVAEPPPEDAESFESILSRLEAAVEKLEDGDLPLEKALAVFEEGVALSRAGSSRLDAAERRIEELLSDRPLKVRPLDREG
jgi:exodeoxyribonuclease VII small subunit